MQALCSVVSEKIFSCYLYYKPLADNDAPCVWPIWTQWTGLAGLIKGITKHRYTQNIKALGLMVSEKKVFYGFPIVCLWLMLMTPGMQPVWTPGA